MFDQQPDLLAAIEDKPRLPGDDDDQITQTYPQVHQDEDSSHLANAGQYARPQTADLVQALKSMRRARERKKHMKVSESKKKYDAYRLDKKLRASKRAFIMRKRRGIQVDLEMARELVGSRLELYFQEEERWRLGSVVEMRVQWTHGGTQLQVLHSVCYYGAEEVLCNGKI